MLLLVDRELIRLTANFGSFGWNLPSNFWMRPFQILRLSCSSRDTCSGLQGSTFDTAPYTSSTCCVFCKANAVQFRVEPPVELLGPAVPHVEACQACRGGRGGRGAEVGHSLTHSLIHSLTRSLSLPVSGGTSRRTSRYGRSASCGSSSP